LCVCVCVCVRPNALITFCLDLRQKHLNYKTEADLMQNCDP